MKFTNNIPFWNQMTEIEKSAQKMAALAQPVLASNFAKYEQMLENIYSDMEIFAKLASQIDFADSIAPALQAMSQSMATVNQFANIDSLSSALSSASAAISDVSWYPDLDFAIPVLEEELKDEPEAIQEIPQSIRERKPLTFEQLCALLSVLIAIITLILQMRPDPQEAELIRQGEIQIQQNEKIIELLEEKDTEETNVAESLLQAVASVADEIQLLTETAEKINNEIDIPENAVDVSDNSISDSDISIESPADQQESDPHDETNSNGIP